MTLQEVMERSAIDLPRPLTLTESEELLAHLAKSLPARISCKLGQHKLIDCPKEEVLIEQGTSNLNASIMCRGDLAGSDFVQFEPSREDTSKLERIRFATIPGYDNLSEYRPETVKLWDRTRELVEQYFSR